MKTRPILINITGPTASGKTAVAIDVAKALNTEIISADSRQIYKEMSVGTAVPSEEELKAVKHHFIRSISITESFSAGDFEQRSLKIIEKLGKTKRYIVMAGGTGLYFNAVNFGLDNIPGIPGNIRKELTETLNRQGIETLRKELRDKDPVYFAQVDKNNPHRLIRALEVIRHTGKPFSIFRKQVPKPRFFQSRWFGLHWPREVLYERINRRVEQMIDKGLIDEARKLYPYKHFNALQTVGYRELFDFFDGKISLEEAVEEIKKNTRRYAKRQLTWFKKNPDIRWIDMQKENPVQIILESLINL